MLHRLPKSTPPLSMMVHDLGSPKPAQLARALGVTERTVYRWLADDHAPFPTMLALFWITQWGAQWLDVDLFNRANTYQALAEALQREKLRAAGLPPSDHEKSAHEGRPLLYLVR